ncbi:MAG: CotH kinase family protein [Balneolales bacterium]|nr:CotH kinase family protein [Balneolales bacterium]
MADVLPVFSHESGFYEAPLEISLSHAYPHAQIYLTFDGSIPNSESELYTETLLLEDRSAEPDVLTQIPTNNLDESFRAWFPPASPVRKAVVVRAVAKINGLYTPPVTRTYFVYEQENEPDFTLGVVSLVFPPDSLFGYERGIYVPGINGSDENPHSGNFNQRGIEWEREVSFELFEHGNIMMRQDAGVRTHGGFSRHFPMKSLRLYARGEFGENRFNYPFFPDNEYNSFNRLILRNSGNDFGFTMFMDAAAQAVVRNMNFDTQAYRPLIVFLNGEYWGVHNLRERYDKHYLERVYGVDGDNIDLLTNRYVVSEGDNEDYLSMLTYALENDLSDPYHFEYMQTRMDIDNYLDYYTAQVYFGNNDWPQNNIIYWRNRVSFNPNAPAGHDGRWRWMVFDVDRSLGYYTDASYDMLEWILLPENPRTGQAWPNELFLSLMDNPRFRNGFINRIADHLNTTFLPERVEQIVNELLQPLVPNMDEHINRWVNHESYDIWLNNRVPLMFTYAQDRPEYLTQHVLEHFGLEGTHRLRLDIASGNGEIQLNSLNLSTQIDENDEEVFPWSGFYFGDIPVNIEAKAAEGWRFSHWEYGTRGYDSIIPTDPEVELNLRGNFNLTAHFVAAEETLPEQNTLAYWVFDTDLPNNTALEYVEPVFSLSKNALLSYKPAVQMYPPSDPNDTDGIMDRVNDPTTENYIPLLNNDLEFEISEMRGLRVRNPSLVDSRESALILHSPTTGFDLEKAELQMAVRRTNSGQEQLHIEYAIDDSGEWHTDGLSQSQIFLPELYTVIEITLSNRPEIAQNPDFAFRIRFGGDESIRTGSQGNVRFNNIRVGAELPQAIEVPPATTLLQPRNGSTLPPADQSFCWQTTDLSNVYQMQISAQPDFREILVNEMRNEIHISPCEGAAGVNIGLNGMGYRQYYWRVRGMNIAGVAEWSETAMFELSTQDPQIPAEFVLMQNYPNPFNPATTIEFMVSEPSSVRVEIYSITGKLVQVLANQRYGTGTHQLSFDASRLSSGVYIYRMQVGEFAESRKMLLLR